MRFLPPKSLVSGGRNACPARVPCLFGWRTTLVWLANNACSARRECLLRRKTGLFGSKNSVFGLRKPCLFLFQMSVFCYRSVSEANAEFRFRFSDGRAVGRKYRILGGLAMQSVKMSTVGCRRARWADGCRRAVEKKLLIAGTPFGGNTYLCSSPTGERS